MRTSTIASCLLILALWGQQKPTPTPTPTPKPMPTPAPTLLQRLYKLVWPAGRFDGDLAKTVAETTEKTGKPDGTPQIWLVNAERGTLTAWPKTLGAVEPVVSSDGQYLFYRRGAGIWYEEIKATAQAVESAAPAKPLAGIQIKYLFGCTQDENGQLALWAETDEGIRLAQFNPMTKAARLAAPPNDGEWASVDSKQLVGYLQNLRAMRPDSFRVWVRNYKLVGRKDEKSRLALIIKSEQRFFGSPAWVAAQSPFFFVTGG